MLDLMFEIPSQEGRDQQGADRRGFPQRQKMDRLNAKELVLPLIPLRELVAFPTVIVPILVGRDKSVNALKASLSQYGGYIFLAAQKNQVTETPAARGNVRDRHHRQDRKIGRAEQRQLPHRHPGPEKGPDPPLRRQPGFSPGAPGAAGGARRSRQGPAGPVAQPHRPVRGIHQSEAGAPARHHDPAASPASSPTPSTSSSPSSTSR